MELFPDGVTLVLQGIRSDQFAIRDASQSSTAVLELGNGGPIVPVSSASTPANSPLTIGLVPMVNAHPYGFSSEGQFDVANCGATEGALYISDVGYDASGNLIRLAADFSAACGDGYERYVSGALRYNSSIPLALNQTFAVAGSDRAVTEGEVVTLDGSASWNPTSETTSLHWTQLSGPAFDLSSCQLGVCTTYAPKVAAGGATATFQLAVTTANGGTAAAQVNIHVRSWQDTQYRFDLGGDGFLSGSSDVHLNETDASFQVPIKDGTEAVYLDQLPERIELISPLSARAAPGVITPWNLVLSNPAGVPLTTGAYSGFGSAGFVPGTTAGLSFSGNGRGCSTTDWQAQIAALSRNPSDYTQINTAAIWFQAKCITLGVEEPSPAYGRYWINYTPVNPPTASASAPATATAGLAFTVMDKGSTAPAGNTMLTTVQQVFGTPVQSLSANSDGSFVVVPSPSTPTGSSIVLAYLVTDALGQSGVALIKVSVTSGLATPAGLMAPRKSRSAYAVAHRVCNGRC